MKKWARVYYYLVPLWFIVESTIWPGLRSQVLAGNSLGGKVAFYAVEAAIGAAYWLQLPLASYGALIENVLYLISALRFVLFVPWDIASEMDGHAAHAELMAASYQHSLPGVLISIWQVMVAIREKLPQSEPIELDQV